MPSIGKREMECMEKKGSATFIKKNPKSLSAKDIAAPALIAFGLFMLFTGRALLGVVACIVGHMALSSCWSWGSIALLIGGMACAVSALVRSDEEGMIWVLLGSIVVVFIQMLDTRGLKSKPTVKYSGDYSGDYSGGSRVIQDEMTPAEQSDAKARQHGFRDADDAYQHGYDTFATGDSRSYTTFGGPHTKL